MPKQWGGEGVRAGQGRACPVCSQRYDVSIGGWRCGHGVTRSSTFAEKVSAAITRRGEVSPALQTETAAPLGEQRDSHASPWPPGEREQSVAGGAAVAGDNICTHGFVTWLDCTACTNAADFDDGEVGLS